jgi:hypothetical protein
MNRRKLVTVLLVKRQLEMSMCAIRGAAEEHAAQTESRDECNAPHYSAEREGSPAPRQRLTT